MDSDFIKVFEPFSIIITTLNYKLKTNYKLSDNDIENIKLMKIMIPIFNRIKNDKTITLEQILNDDHQTNHVVLPSAPTIKVPTDTDSDEYIFINKKSEEEPEIETSEDLEGDLQVETLTNESLNLLKFIRDNSWVHVEHVSDIEIEIEDDSEEDGEEDGDDEVVEKIPLSFGEDQEAPLLVSAN